MLIDNTLPPANDQLADSARHRSWTASSLIALKDCGKCQLLRVNISFIIINFTINLTISCTTVIFRFFVPPIPLPALSRSRCGPARCTFINLTGGLALTRSLVGNGELQRSRLAVIINVDARLARRSCNGSDLNQYWSLIRCDAARLVRPCCRSCIVIQWEQQQQHGALRLSFRVDARRTDVQASRLESLHIRSLLLALTSHVQTLLLAPPLLAGFCFHRRICLFVCLSMKNK